MPKVILRTEGLTKSYGPLVAVNDLTLEIYEGEILGFLGPNGAGKTTTFYMVTGIVKPDMGHIIFDKKDITKLPIHQRARSGIGYLSQEPSIFRKLSVEENIMAVMETLGFPRKERQRQLDNLLNQLKISHLRKNKAYTLSGGERRRLEITRSMVTNPMFILLDEPFSGIDPIAVFDCQELIKELKEMGLGILLTDHNVRETLTITDRSYIMFEGQILISGTKEELINDPKAREIYLGERFSM